jgi:hypothetical protein
MFKDLLTKTEGATWFKKVNDGDGRAAHLLLRKHYGGKAHRAQFKELNEKPTAIPRYKHIGHEMANECGR